MGHAFFQYANTFVPAVVVIETVPKRVSIQFIVAGKGKGKHHFLVRACVIELGHGGAVEQQVEEGDFARLGVRGLGLQSLVVDIIGVGLQRLYLMRFLTVRVEKLQHFLVVAKTAKIIVEQLLVG